MQSVSLARTILRPFTPEDSELLFELHSDEELARIVPFVVHANIDQSRELLARILGQTRSGASIGWVIALAGRSIGTIGLLRIDHGTGQADIAYHLVREHWGSGLAKEAVGGALHVAFDDLKLRRVTANIDSLNVRSSRFAEKLGFVRELTFPEPWNGTTRTTHRYVKRNT
ncbi:MAG TPA: GNAT family N-acetyltransferase [Polyangiaceae bacterium]|nr:GNAT family N-acetyltransferase [Polyangiaceae bacterium]